MPSANYLTVEDTPHLLGAQFLDQSILNSSCSVYDASERCIHAVYGLERYPCAHSGADVGAYNRYPRAGRSQLVQHRFRCVVEFERSSDENERPRAIVDTPSRSLQATSLGTASDEICASRCDRRRVRSFFDKDFLMLKRQHKFANMQASGH